MGIFKFVGYFTVSLLVIIFLLDSINNNFVPAFIISIVIAILGSWRD